MLSCWESPAFHPWAIIIKSSGSGPVKLGNLPQEGHGMHAPLRDLWKMLED